MKHTQTIARAARMIQTRQGTKKVMITFYPFNWDDVNLIKEEMPNRKFKEEGSKKYWVCDLSIEAVEILEDNGFDLDENLRNFVDRVYTRYEEVEEYIDDSELNEKLYNFQKKGVNFIEQKDGNALIADQMGLGKTVQALSWLRLHPEKKPVLIVVPASLKLNWERETKIWLKNSSIQILSGKTPYEIKKDIVIINYDIIKDWQEVLREHGFKVIILDESHFIKNNQAQRTQAVKKIGKHIPHVIGLTGTPIENRPIEIYNIINLIDRSIFPSWFKYVRKYCAAHHDRFGLNVKGASNTAKLHKILSKSCMLRRKKQDVLRELPDKIRTFLPVDISNRKDYQFAESNFIAFLRETKGKQAARKASNAETLAKIETLKQVAVKGKMKMVKDWIKDMIDSNGKLVVFCHHKFVIEQLMREFATISVKVDGSVTGENRQKAIDAFQNEPSVKLFIGNMKAAGVGITLTAASNVAFLELGWSNSTHQQASDRLHRIGQKDVVNEYYLIAPNTIEDKIAALIDQKRVVVDMVTDGIETQRDSLLSQLISDYYEEPEEEQ